MGKEIPIWGIRGLVVQEEQSLIINEPGAHPAWIGLPEGHPRVDRFLGVPLKQGGRTRGLIALANKASPYTRVDVEGVEALNEVFVQALEHIRTELRLEQSEEQQRLLFESDFDVIYVFDSELRITKVSPSVKRILGYRPEDLEGRLLQELDLFEAESLDHALSNIQRVLAGEIISSSEYTLRARDGSRRITQISSSPVFEQGLVSGVISVGRDITQERAAEQESRRANRALQVLSRCNHALVHVGREADLPGEICRICVEYGGYDLAWVGFVEQEATKGVRLVASAGPGLGYLQDLELTWADTEKGRGPVGRAVRSNEAVIARDVRTDPGFAPWRQKALEYGFASVMAIPLRVNGSPEGVLTLYAAEPEAFQGREADLLQELAHDLAYGLGNLRARAERDQTRQELQSAVARLRKTVSGSIAALSATLEARDPYTAGHQMRVSDLARAIATEMGLDPERIEGIRLAGSIHDLGKISVPADILSKPTRLSDNEFGLIKDHPGSGYEILDDGLVRPRCVLVLARRIGKTYLKTLSANYAIHDPLFRSKADRSRSGAQISLDGIDKTRLGRLTWSPRLPSGLFLNRILPYTGLTLLLIALVTWLIVKRLSRMIQERAASSNFLQDIADQEKEKQALKRDYENAKMYKLLTENMFDVIWKARVEPEGAWQFIYTSPSLKRLLGYTQEEALADLFQCLSASSHETLLQAVSQYCFRLFSQDGRNDKSPAERPLRLELELIRKDGQRLWTETLINARLDETGHTAEVEGVTRDMTEHKRLEKKLEERSNTDALTGLYSRAFFEQEMKRLKDGRLLPLAIVVGDLDGLKLVNDGLGHQQGDRLLQAVARIFKVCVRGSDILARIGGDEFAVLLPQSRPELVQQIVERFKKELARYNQDHPPLPLSVSTGWAVCSSKPVDTESLFREADNRMYQEKRLNRDLARSTMQQALRTYWEGIGD